MSESKPSDGQYKVIFLRYRPTTFEEIIGQGHLVQALQNAIAQGRVGHAYLFTGARGVGKTSAARIFAKALNCVDGPTKVPCNKCDACLSIAQGNDVDVLEIDGASNRGIDEIRDLRSNAIVRPSRSRLKIYIIDEVHMLTTAAFNALLKTLEEPPSHVKFIFCTTDPEKMPITVLSRCQRFDFAPIETELIKSRLKQIVTAEGLTAEDEALQLLARRAAGSMRDSQSLLEQLLSFCNERITVGHVHEMLGTAQSGVLAELAGHLVQRDPASALAALDKAVLEGVDVGQLADQLVGYFRDLLVAAVGAEADLMLNSRPEDFADLQAVGQELGAETLMAALQILDQSLARMRVSVQVRTLLEVALVRICRLEQLDEISTLIGQLQAGGTGEATPNAARSSVRLPAKRPTVSPQKKNDQAADSAPAPEIPAPPPVSEPALPTQSEAAQEPAKPVVESVDASSPPVASDPPEVGETVAESSNPPNSPAMEWTEQNLTAIWQRTLEEVGGMAAAMANSCTRLAISAPNRLVVAFSAEYTLKWCERPERRAPLESALAKLTGQPIRLEFQLESAPAAQPKPRPKSLREQQRELEKNPLVAEAMTVFEAEITHVDKQSK